MSKCPCGLNKSYPECCGLFISGKELPPTAEALMRSRYSAYVKHEIDYIESTHVKDSGEEFDRAAAKTWSEQTDWQGLEIRSTEAGGADDAEGTVEFIARFRTKIPNQPEQDLAHHEVSLFRKDGNGRWLYVDGKIIRTPVKRASPKVGRNDPCGCGSGKKNKKCCGA